MGKKRLRTQLGATLVEVLVAIALTGILLPALATTMVSSQKARPASTQSLQAEGLVREATAAVRSVREKGWSNVSTDGTYHPVISGNAWTLSAGSETIGNFTRQIVISTPQRNSSGVLVSSSGTNDPNTKHVVVTVSWSTPYSSSLSTDTYLTRWQTNSAWTQTTQTDFNGGTLTNTAVTNISGGEVQLANATPTWGSPSVAGSYDITGNVSGLSVYYATISSIPYAFVGYATGMAIVNVSNPASPTLTGTYATTAAVNGIFVSGTTAYLATAMTTSQLVLVNVATPSAPAKISSLQVGGNTVANAVTVVGTTAYVVNNTASGTNGDFNIVNVSVPALPTITGKLKVGANNTGVVVSGNFAYISTSTNNKQLEAISISNPAAPTAGNTVSLGANGTGIALSGTNLFITTANNASAGELRIYSISTPGSFTAVGSYEVGGNVNGMSVSGNYVQLVTGVANTQLINVNVTTPATPTLSSNFTLSNTGNAVFTSGNYAYIGTADTAKELTIVSAGAGYQPSGTFESSSFDATATAGFNYLTFTASQPGGSNVKLQIASNNDNATWNYVGTDGTASTYFTTGSAIPLGAASGRYFRYKEFFTAGSSNSTTAVVSDVTLNYSP